MTAMPRGAKFALTALALLSSITVYAFFHEHLFSLPLWTDIGRHRFLTYSGFYWIVAGVLLAWAPRWIGVMAIGCATAYIVWWCGLAAPAAALYFLGACFCLGRIVSRRSDVPTAILVGLTGWIFVMFIALHFRVNTRGVYAVAMAIPYLWEIRSWRGWSLTARFGAFRFLCKSRAEASALALLIFLLFAHLLVALKPEIGDDALSMHLALPMAVAHDARWTFDFIRYTWALMPAGGDFAYTAAYLLAGTHGGEAAAHLVNFALLALIAAMVANTAQRWMEALAPSQERSAARPFLIAALFVATPLALLVTGSLMVENVWAALVLGGSLAVARYAETAEPEELILAGILFGGALSAKVLAGVYLLPAAAIAAWVSVQRKHYRTLAAAVLCLCVLGAPIYIYSWTRSGNPVFPFYNGLFHSPDFDATSFHDPYALAPLASRNPYVATFHSRTFSEGQGGAVGFQYFLLLLPGAALLAFRPNRSALVLLAIAGTGVISLFAVAPNLRYMYPALPMFSLILGIYLIAEAPGAAAVMVAVTLLDAWFLPAAGWYDRDFALFRKRDIPAYILASAPERILIDRLNREYPGEPVAFFRSESIAGLHARAYIDGWHTYAYWQQLLDAGSSRQIAEILTERGVRHLVAPIFRQAFPILINDPFENWADPEGPPAGRMQLYRLRQMPRPVPLGVPLPPGDWDDLDPHIEYTGGHWFHDRQFGEAFEHSVTYSQIPSDSLHASFSGSSITYVFTRAANRGIALVLIDGRETAHIDEYAAGIEWRSRRIFAKLGPGRHTIEIRLLDEHNPLSTGTYVDLDELIVEP